MYSLVVFDLDGTLCDTLSDLANSVNEALLSYNLPTHPLSAYRQFVGNGVNSLITQALGDKAEDKDLHASVKGFFDTYYPMHLCDNTVEYTGMSKLLSKLSHLGVKTAVHSNKPHHYIPVILQKLFSNHSFDAVFGQQENYERKPSPQVLLKIMEMLGVDKDSTLYVGDSDVDVMTAHGAKVKVCGVSWGFRGKEELIDAGADFIAENAQELLSIIVG